MKRTLVLILLAAILIVASPALASTTSTAKYSGIITITNNSTAATNVIVPVSINTAQLITNSMLNSSVTDSAVLSSGTDVAYGPQYGSTNWWLFVPSIGTSSSIPNNLYVGGGTSMSSKLRYFPGAGGMTTADNDTYLELGDNFTIEQKGWIDTTAGANKNLFDKSGAITANITAAGTITATIGVAYSANQSAQDLDANLSASYSTRVGERFTAFSLSTITSVSFYLKKTLAPTGTANITVRDSGTDALLGTLGTQNVALLTTSYAWYTYTTPLTVSASDIRILFEYSGGDVNNYVDVGGKSTDTLADAKRTLYDGTYTNYNTQDATIAITATAFTVTATGIASAEHTSTIRADGTLLELAVGTTNYVWNSGFELGNPATSWTLEGAGASVARSTTQVKVGTYSEALTRAGTDTRFFFQIPNPNQFLNTTVTAGAWVWASVANRAYISIQDSSAHGNSSSYHAGDSTWQWLTVTYTPIYDLTGGWIRPEMRVYNGDTTAYFDGAKLVTGTTVTPDTYPVSTVSFTNAVTNNGNNWAFLQNGVMPYMEYQKIWVGGNLRQHITYQYTATFTDQSGNGQDATPTWPTTSSDADVSAVLSSLVSTSPSQIASYSITVAGTILSGSPDMPSQMYTSGNYTKIPGGAIVNTFLDAGGIPRAMWWYPFVFGIIILLGLMFYSVTSGGNRTVLPMCIITEVLLFFVGIINPVPLVGAFLFPIAAFSIISSQKHYSLG